MAGLRDIEYVEMWVEDAASVATMYQETFGFDRVAEAGPETGLAGHRSVVLTQGDANLVITSSIGPNGVVADFVARHGDGVRDVAFATDDVRQVYDQAVARGAPSISEPSRATHNGASVVRAAISGFDDLVHT